MAFSLPRSYLFVLVDQAECYSPSSTPAPLSARKNGKPESTSKKPFSRIDHDKIVYASERVKDNTFQSLGFPEGHYTTKAHQDLIVTKGKNFTKEKNKVCPPSAFRNLSEEID